MIDENTAQEGTPWISPGTEEMIAVICRSGYRSSVAASILQAVGYWKMVNVEGGMVAWKNADLPVSTMS